jgi:hypothetical protein
VGLLFYCAEVAVLAVSLALASGPFGGLAVDWADVGDDGCAHYGIKVKEQQTEKERHA